MWDSFYRYEYERNRMSWDPYFRHMKEEERLQWDPWYRTLKEIERKQWDSEYRWQKYEEKRMGSQWLEAYYENPMDPVLRQRYEMLYGRRQDRKPGLVVEHGFTQSSNVQSLSISPPIAGEDRAQTQTAHTDTQTPSKSSYSYVPYLSSEELPSLASVLAESIIPVSIVWFFTLATGLGWGSASPFALALLFMFAAIFLGAAEAKRATALLLIYSIPLLLLEPWTIGDPQTVRNAQFNSLLKAAVILSIIGALYILYWWNKIREEG